MKLRTTVLFIVCLVSLRTSIVLLATADIKSEISLSDDAYHFTLDGSHDESYVEWWYYNLFDEVNGFQFYASYFVADPGNMSGLGQVQLGASVFLPDGEAVSGVEFFSFTNFSASYERCDVRMGENYCVAVDDETYLVSGRAGPLAWNLTYRRGVGGYWSSGFQNLEQGIQVGHLKWEWMQWLVYMTGAEVEGEIRVYETPYEVAGRGYHDHNWGEWLFFDPMWNWQQVSRPEDGFSISFGDVRFLPGRNGTMGVYLNHSLLMEVFHPDYKVYNRAWEFDEEHRAFYPTEMVIIASDKDHILVYTVEVLRVVALIPEIPGSVLDIIIFECVSNFKGVLFFKGDGSLKPLYSFDQTGFSEYTCRVTPLARDSF